MKRNTFYGILLVVTCVCSLFTASILIEDMLPEYKYETKLHTNSNSITQHNGEVVDYMCDEGVVFEYFSWGKSYFISTWAHDRDVKEEYKGITGKCMVKLKVKVIK